MVEEVKKYKTTLRQLCKSQGGGVFYFREIIRATIFVPLSHCSANDIKDAYVTQAQEEQMELAVGNPELSDIKPIAQPGGMYFYVEIDRGKKLSYKIKKKKKFPLQLKSEVLAREVILHMPDRSD